MLSMASIVRVLGSKFEEIMDETLCDGFIVMSLTLSYTRYLKTNSEQLLKEFNAISKYRQFDLPGYLGIKHVSFIKGFEFI